MADRRDQGYPRYSNIDSMGKFHYHIARILEDLTQFVLFTTDALLVEEWPAVWLTYSFGVISKECSWGVQVEPVMSKTNITVISLLLVLYMKYNYNTNIN